MYKSNSGCAFDIYEKIGYNEITFGKRVNFSNSAYPEGSEFVREKIYKFRTAAAWVMLQKSAGDRQFAESFDYPRSKAIREVTEEHQFPQKKAQPPFHRAVLSRTF